MAGRPAPHGIPANDLRMYIIAAARIARGRLGSAKLHNTFFLLSIEVDGYAARFDYAPGKYGPYSQILQTCLDGLEKDGLVEITGETDMIEHITLTEEGKIVSEDPAASINAGAARALAEYDQLFYDMTFDEMTAYINAMYPRMSTKSEIYKRQIRPRIERHVRSLVSKEKFTEQRGAELLQDTHGKPPENAPDAS